MGEEAMREECIAVGGWFMIIKCHDLSDSWHDSAGVEWVQLSYVPHSGKSLIMLIVAEIVTPGFNSGQNHLQHSVLLPFTLK